MPDIQHYLAKAREYRAAMDVALGAVVAKGLADASPDIVIRSMALFRAWEPKAFVLNEPCLYDGQPYRCCQPHDSTDNSAWTPEASPAQFALYHARTVDTALRWAQPTGTHDMYLVGEYMVWKDRKTYRCTEDTAYNPEQYPKAWEAVN